MTTPASLLHPDSFLSPLAIDEAVRRALNEDLGRAGDITSIATIQMSDALSNVLRTLDKYGLVNQRGYEILIQAFALKIFDEKRNERNPRQPLKFYITDREKEF